MSRALQAVREAVVDGRLQNVMYRQTQLEKLHQVLVGNIEAAERAIRRDSGHSNPEAAIEFTLTLQAVRDYYATLNEKESLHSEYALARGEDAPDRRDAIGLVYIVPPSYSLFYSVIVAATAAIAAGNCVVVELGNTLLEVPSILRQLLKTALDPSIIEFTSEPATDEDLGLHHIRVFQDSRSAAKSSISPCLTVPAPLISMSDSRAVAIIDRGVDIKQTASAIVTARFGFGGNSPYAPDVVLVHEFIKKEFLVAVVEEMMRLTVNLSAAKSVDQERGKRVEDLLQNGVKSGEMQLSTSTNKGSIYDVKSRRSEALRSKIYGTNLLVLGVRSLDDAITLASQQSDTLLASYIFAAPRAAKYLSQFVSSQASFVNQIPQELLVGPAAPRFAQLDRSLRYPLSILTITHAEYTTRTAMSELVQKSLRDTSSNDIVKVLKGLSAPLKPKTTRAAGGQIGYFEQGIFIGLGMFGVPIVLAIGGLGSIGIRAGIRAIRS